MLRPSIRAIEAATAIVRCSGVSGLSNHGVGPLMIKVWETGLRYWDAIKYHVSSLSKLSSIGKGLQMVLMKLPQKFSTILR